VLAEGDVTEIAEHGARGGGLHRALVMRSLPIA
jgi:hypothetical protein